MGWSRVKCDGCKGGKKLGCEVPPGWGERILFGDFDLGRNKLGSVSESPNRNKEHDYYMN